MLILIVLNWIFILLLWTWFFLPFARTQVLWSQQSQESKVFDAFLLKICHLIHYLLRRMMYPGMSYKKKE